jgi:hypothetical protein
MWPKEFQFSFAKFGIKKREYCDVIFLIYFSHFDENFQKVTMVTI